MTEKVWRVLSAASLQRCVLPKHKNMTDFSELSVRGIDEPK